MVVFLTFAVLRGCMADGNGCGCGFLTRHIAKPIAEFFGLDTLIVLDRILQ